MSTYSIPVAGPSAQFAMIQGWISQLAQHARTWWHTTRHVFNSGSSALKAGTNLALGAIGSKTGYSLITGALKSGITTMWHGIQWVFSSNSRALGRLARFGYALLGKISPRAAKAVEDAAERFLVEPLLNAALWVQKWIGNLGDVLWELTQTSLVRGVTTISAQLLAIVLSVHTLTKGALAAKLVSLLPWTMDAVIAITNPYVALGVVAAVFVSALLVAGMTLTRSTPDEPQPVGATLQNDGRPATQLSPWKLEEIAAKLRIEVTVNGSVIVHGIPEEVPLAEGERIAQIAAEAAVARVQKIWPIRQRLTRDDRRLINKVAREAVRNQARQAA